MHSCPECEQACFCDMEDHDTGDEFAEDCLHVCDEEREDNDDHSEPGLL